MSYHKPVLLEESVDWMQIKPDGVYVDATFGGGGHSKYILEQLNEKGRWYSFDQDEEAAANAESPIFEDNPSFEFVPANFRYIQQMLLGEEVELGTVDAILADLGVSSHQIDTAERGFSHRFDADLDMRMNRMSGEKTAAEVLNTYSVEELQHIFSTYGEVRNAKTLAATCVETRNQIAFQQTSQLVAVCESLAFGNPMRYLSQVFQALRIEVNDEMNALAEFFEGCKAMLKPGSGRLVVLSYHSLEDRMAKHFLKTGNANGEVQKDFYGKIDRPFKVLTKKAIEASPTETKVNSRARSVKMRVGLRL